MALTLVAGTCVAASSLQQPAKGHPKITLRTTPGMAVAPARILAIAELVGGADDDADFYCPRVEWTWGDQTTSDQQSDCDPYVPGKSTIDRRISADHRYDMKGIYPIFVKLFQGQKEVGSARGSVTITSGMILTPPTAAALPWRSGHGF